ncbi:hypothetical protein Q9L41_18140 [Vibrio cholerae]|uniref:hypothetical protein n=1 Tax=Vibrio cholerae TaxID=666 RepID=UPI0020897C8C|nr:hypothetical protein [Vibrio cholerae]MDP4497625.1 hypothetical protein [Vibrio cholerae]MDP4497717.1 hypothetical protein [Vibrio cholerae]WLP78728.1 hypothetical protein Q9L40_01605 [Vibrio cholerae]WLP78811.1 hypothetical protein Q9L40_02105 [Vibrio cholerae]GIC06408.1 hypothetical protein VCSRO97_3462 [Vibrio cholerae]
MKVDNMPLNLYQLLESLDLMQPKQCFTNCLMAVLNMNSKIYPRSKYVLCNVSYLGGIFQHAVIKCGDRYFDPTLEAQGLHRLADYEYKWECTKTELMEMLFDKFGPHELPLMLEGERPFWPLVLNELDEPRFVDSDA